MSPLLTGSAALGIARTLRTKIKSPLIALRKENEAEFGIRKLLYRDGNVRQKTTSVLLFSTENINVWPA